MEKNTVNYKRTLRGSVGAGMGALLNGDGRRYYILEHKDASKYHKAGESQKIIIDQIELGRDPNCQVRFDDTYPTVSRKHAAIVRDGDRWKLVQLSKTNSTLLNGKPIDKEWYLENGDEIQLSVGGPKIGFIVPQGKNSLVSSIKMTERLNLFRKQALKPYKTAIAVLFVLLVILGGGAGFIINNQGKEIVNLLNKSNNIENAFAQARNKWTDDSLSFEKKIKVLHDGQKVVVYKDPGKEIAKMLDVVKPSVYAITTDVYIGNDTESELLCRSQGTGFLLEDGTFVTARHCVEPWMYDLGQIQALYAYAKNSGAFKMYSKITAINMEGKRISLTDTDFRVDRTHDSPVTIPFELGDETIDLNGMIACGTTASLGSDWAYYKTSSNGSISKDSNLSQNLKSGTTVHLLGFPKSIGINDGDHIVDPIYNNMNVSRDGLNESRCIMISQGVDHGNSGGPVFVVDNGKLRVIGIVSHGDIKSEIYNHIVPMSNLK